MNKNILLITALVVSSSLLGQKTKTNTAKIDFTNYPTVPVEGVEKLGIKVYTADLPFNKDTLRLYLGNIDMMKSNADRLSKVSFSALNDVAVVGGEGDLTVEMAIGSPMVISKELKQSACTVPKDGCTQYYYAVKYRLPAVVQVQNKSGIQDTWELESEMELQFGNEQVEKHKNTDEGSSTSIQVVSYASEADLALAFNASGDADLVRKGIVTQIGNMADGIYEHVFFEDTTLKLDLTYGSGKAADYEETEKASENAVAALENNNYAALEGPVNVWNTWLERHDTEDKKAAVNDKIAQGLQENLSIAYTFMGEYEKARTHLDEAIALSQSGFVNQNDVQRLKDFHGFIAKQEKAKQNIGALSNAAFVTAPDIKKVLGRRKFNADVDFLFPTDNYAEISGNHGKTAPKKDISEMSIEEFLNQSADEKSDATDSGSDAISLEGRVENNMLILSGLVDGNMRGKALPPSLCTYTELKTIRARNIGLTGLPDCLGELTNLENLYINSNSFESLPDAFGNMQKLEVLDISNNNLKTIPPSIYKLKGLKKIFIVGNQFSEADLKKLEEALPDTKIK